MKINKNQENIKKCLCPTCPSYNQCSKNKNQSVFCSYEVGKSDCPFQMLGCICKMCPVYIENNLKSIYYCINGSADEIDK